MTENYLVNGVPLNHVARGWRLLAATLPRTAQTRSSTKSTFSGRDGHTSSGGVRSGIVPQFEVFVPEGDWETLLALFSAPALVITRADLPGRALYGTLRSSSSPKDYPRVKKVSAVFYVDVPGGCWRGSEVTTPLFSAAPVGVTASMFSGLSAPVQDALVRIKGPVQNPQILDPSGAFLSVDESLTASQYLRFNSDTGRAWTTTTDTWVGGSEVSGLIDFGGPRGVFEITPTFTTPTDPTARTGRLTLSYDSYNAGAGFQVRGRPAFLT